MDIYERIKTECEKRGANVKALEQEIGLSNGSIGKWKVSSPKAETIAKVADYFNVSVDYLLGRTDDLTPIGDSVDAEFAEMELGDVLEALKSRDEMRMLFCLTKDATREDVLQAVKIIEALKK